VKDEQPSIVFAQALLNHLLDPGRQGRPSLGHIEHHHVAAIVDVRR
jgi:hypothetical protein